MPQRKKGPALGSDPKHQQLMLRNLARSLFEHERLKTTETKAKLLRPYAERLITKAKAGSIHDRRQVLSLIADREVVHKLFSDIGPRFSERPGGYTRVLKLGTRPGDGAEMAIIELVEGAGRASAGATEEATSRRRRLRRPSRRRGAAAGEGDAPETTDEAAADEDVASEPEAAAEEEAEPDDEDGDDTPAKEGDESSAS